MSPLKSLRLWLKDFFVSVPIEQFILSAGEEAQIEIAQRNYTMQREAFARHLAIAKQGINRG